MNQSSNDPKVVRDWEWAAYNEKRAKNGYAALPNCPKCKGSGFTHPNREDDTPDYSRIVSCDYPGCIKDDRRKFQAGEVYWKRHGFKANQTFATFNQEIGTGEAYAAFHSLAMGDPGFKPFLLCYGGTGNGKTHLCNALAITLAARGIAVRLWAAADMFAELKASINNNRLEDKIKEFKSIQALVIDDLGANLGSDWELARLDEMIDYRYRNELITVITTNILISSLPHRLSSRFLDESVSVAVANNGMDYRQTGGK